MKLLKRIFLTLLVLSLLLGAAAGWWVLRPLPLVTPTVDLSIAPQTPVRGIAQAAVEAGIEVQPELLYVLFRLSGQSRKLRAGSYEITQGNTALDVLRKLTRGEESLKAITLIDGWTFRQFRAALDKAEGLKHDTRQLSDSELMEKLGLPDVAPEGRFFPDTYTYGKGTSELHVMQRAANAMVKQLAAAWGQRAGGLQVKTQEQALILASIIEKETGRESDRTTISRVFHNRLAIDMPLQTDPTVIYGLGESFDGNLRRTDLRTDHPWNTYTRKGLPITPIAMPGRNALLAAVKPANSRALYFVARGDGTSEFSVTLDAHNAAVNRYQRRASAAQAASGQ
ncbi:endolytic transglycosylase MltG [Limnohabitans sp.]|uniref:endolytic transglycosylase MltG n=1 Tax=Limnohabitans sp. TaxID=1907725 RepID=UPI00286F994C|nr:endolytic transglycosylase MltG [Limnohabitans sp.]